jgi:hypothetical protein
MLRLVLISVTPWPRRHLGGSGLQSGTQSTFRSRAARPSHVRPRADSAGPAPVAVLRRQWPVAAAGVLAAGALTFALVASGGTGAGAQPGPAVPSSAIPTGSPVIEPSSAVPESEGAEATEKSTKGGKTGKKKVKIPAQGPGTFTRARVDGQKMGARGAPLLRYAVKVEKKLPYDADETALAIQTTLSDQRSWIGGGDWRLELVSDLDKADFTIYLATPGTVDRYCWPLRTYGRVSCQAGNRVMLNAWRWAHGADAFDDDVGAYRQYLVNHEVGHRLGHGHVGCPGKGKRAPVMMQQTKGVGSCKANPWPAPKRTG